MPIPMLIPITINVNRTVSERVGHVTLYNSFLTSLRNLNISDNFTTGKVQNAKSKVKFRICLIYIMWEHD